MSSAVIKIISAVILGTSLPTVLSRMVSLDEFPSACLLVGILGGRSLRGPPRRSGGRCSSHRNSTHRGHSWGLHSSVYPDASGKFFDGDFNILLLLKVIANRRKNGIQEHGIYTISEN